MTKERLQQIKDDLGKEEDWVPYDTGDPRVVLELIAEVERLQAALEDALDTALIEARKHEPVFEWNGENFVHHVGPKTDGFGVEVPTK